MDIISGADDLDINYIRRIDGEECAGNWRAKTLYLRNNHPARAIRVTVTKRWNHPDGNGTETTPYVINPNRSPAAYGPNEDDVRVACPVSSTTGHPYEFSMIAAWA